MAMQEREEIGLRADGLCPTRGWAGLELVGAIVSRTKEVDEKINGEETLVSWRVDGLEDAKIESAVLGPGCEEQL